MSQILTQYDPPSFPAVPTAYKVPFGIVLAITPTDNTYAVEVWRAPDNGSGSPDTGNMETVDSRLYAAHGDVFVDQLPNDNAKRFYRWRHIVSGGTAGAYTSWVWARPAFLPQTYAQPKTLVVPLRSMALADGKTNLAAQDATGQTAAADVYVPSANTVKVGTAAVPGSLTKTLRFPYLSFVPITDLVAFSSSTYLDPRTVGGGGSSLTLAIPLPLGITLTSFASRGFRNAAGDTCNVGLAKLDDGAVFTSLALNTHAATAAWSTVTSAISETVTTGWSYYLSLFLLSSVAATDSRFLWVDITYTVPDYSKSY